MKKKILIYQDQGTFREGVRHTSSTFQELLGFNYEIQLVSARDLLQRTWEKSTALLIFPGGADIPYMKLLKGRGNQRIRSYVENGGAFIGICAGAYYSGDIVEFALNTRLEVREERELKFFPGIVRGPLLAPYEYETPSGVRAAKIYCNDLPISLYYNGGGYFKEAEQKKDVLVLGTYLDKVTLTKKLFQL
ncbi:MAG: hypothetical protein KR126chlam3_01716 [Chlamydiae bacterium]|nr:hypothetical protein [Chlamydiota bacterium]